MGSNNLNIDQLATNQASPEVTVNDANAQLDAALTEIFVVDLAGGNVVITAPQYRAAILFQLANVATSGRTVTLPMIKRGMILFESAAVNTDVITLIVGATDILIQPGRTYAVYTDGTVDGVVARDVGGVSEPNDMHIFLPGLMANGQLCYFMNVTRPFTLPIGLAGSVATGQAAATGSTTLTLKKNGAVIGAGCTLVWSGAGTVAAATLAAAVSFAIGDTFSIIGPVTADAKLADISLDIAGAR